MPGPHCELTAMTEGLSDLVHAGKKMARAILDAEAILTRMEGAETSASIRDLVHAGGAMVEAIMGAEARLTRLEAVTSQATGGGDGGDGGLRTPQHLADTTDWPRWRSQSRSRSR